MTLRVFRFSDQKLQAKLQGVFLSPFQKDLCVYKVYFPSEFNVTYIGNHWFNEDKSMELVKHILIAYINTVRNELSLRSTKEWVLITDVFKGQRIESVKYNGKLVPLPYNMTSYFQPLDSNCQVSVVNCVGKKNAHLRCLTVL